MEHLVVDSSVLVASLLDLEEFYSRARQFIQALESRDYIFRLPMLVVVEVSASINRRSQRHSQATQVGWQQNVDDWERDGRIILYPLDRARMEQAVTIAQRDRLKGPDSVIAALAEELSVPLKTFDSEVVDRFHLASV